MSDNLHFTLQSEYITTLILTENWWGDGLMIVSKESPYYIHEAFCVAKYA